MRSKCLLVYKGAGKPSSSSRFCFLKTRNQHASKSASSIVYSKSDRSITKALQLTTERFYTCRSSLFSLGASGNYSVNLAGHLDYWYSPFVQRVTHHALRTISGFEVLCSPRITHIISLDFHRRLVLFKDMRFTREAGYNASCRATNEKR
jgi:hypothetical protein